MRYFLGEPMFRCARRTLPDWVWEVLHLYASWERGALPNLGGVLDQPAPLVDAMHIVAGTLGELARAQAEAARPPAGPTPEGGLRASHPVRFSGRGRKGR